MARVRGGVDHAKLRTVVDTSPRLNAILSGNAHGIASKAHAVFQARQRVDNEWRTSETTPPKYIFSFRVDRITFSGGVYTWVARNVDPAAAWVEYGAHAGGRTAVLRYHPFQIAVIAQGLSN